MRLAFFVRAVDCNPMDVSLVSDLPSGRFVAGEYRVHLHSRADSFWVPWKGELPRVGSQVEIDLEPEAAA